MPATIGRGTTMLSAFIYANHVHECMCVCEQSTDRGLDVTKQKLEQLERRKTTDKILVSLGIFMFLTIFDIHSLMQQSMSFWEDRPAVTTVKSMVNAKG